MLFLVGGSWQASGMCTYVSSCEWVVAGGSGVTVAGGHDGSNDTGHTEECDDETTSTTLGHGSAPHACAHGTPDFNPSTAPWGSDYSMPTLLAVLQYANIIGGQNDDHDDDEDNDGDDDVDGVSVSGMG